MTVNLSKRNNYILEQCIFVYSWLIIAGWGIIYDSGLPHDCVPPFSSDIYFLNSCSLLNLESDLPIPELCLSPGARCRGVSSFCRLRPTHGASCPFIPAVISNCPAVISNHHGKCHLCVVWSQKFLEKIVIDILCNATPLRWEEKYLDATPLKWEDRYLSSAPLRWGRSIAPVKTELFFVNHLNRGGLICLSKLDELCLSKVLPGRPLWISAGIDK